jgi:hypothetical protein
MHATCFNPQTKLHRWQSKMKIDAIFAYAKQNSRRNFADYGGLRLWRSDYRMILKDRKAAMALAWRFKDRELVGKFGRLTVTENSIDYTTGQYMPTEIWWHVHDAMATQIARLA